MWVLVWRNGSRNFQAQLWTYSDASGPSAKFQMWLWWCGVAAWWCMIYYNSSPCLHYSDTDASPAQPNKTLCSFIITTTGRVEGRYSDCLSELQSPSLDIRYNNITHCANNNNNYNNCNNITLLLLSKSSSYIHKKLSISDLQETKGNVGNMESCHIPVLLLSWLITYWAQLREIVGGIYPSLSPYLAPAVTPGMVPEDKNIIFLFSRQIPL